MIKRTATLRYWQKWQPAPYFNQVVKRSEKERMLDLNDLNMNRHHVDGYDGYLPKAYMLDMFYTGGAHYHYWIIQGIAFMLLTGVYLKFQRQDLNQLLPWFFGLSMSGETHMAGGIMNWDDADPNTAVLGASNVGSHHSGMSAQRLRLRLDRCMNAHELRMTELDATMAEADELRANL